MRVGKTFFKSGASALKDGGSLGDSFKSALKPTLKTALKHGGIALGKVIESQQEPAAAPPSEPPLLHQDDRDVGTTVAPKQTGSGRYKGKRRRTTDRVSKGSKKPRINYNF